MPKPYLNNIFLFSILFLATFNCYSQNYGQENKEELILINPDNDEQSETKKKEVRKKALTDEEQDLKNTYTHEGYLKRKFEEECNEDKNKDACLGRMKSKMFKPFGSDMTIDESTGQVFEMAAKAISMFGLMGAMGAGDAADSLDTDSAKKPSKLNKTAQGVCTMLPLAGEALSMFQSTTALTKIKKDMQISQADKQITQLEGQERLFKEKRVTHNIQSGVWSGTAAACFAEAATSKSLSWGTGGTLAKSLAASFLALYYRGKGISAKENLDAVRGIKDRLKSAKKECNPITDPICYCLQAETENDTKFCLPPEFKNRKGPPKIVSCIDSKLKNDPECKCFKTKTCYDKTVENFESDLGPTTKFDKSSYDYVKKLTSGQYDSQLATNLMNQARNALASKLKTLPSPSLKKPLTKYQKEMAQKATQMGIPKNLAKYLAASPVSKKARKYLSSRETAASSNIKYRSWDRGKRKSGKNRVLTFNTNKKSNRNNTGNRYNAFDFLKKFQKKNKKNKRSNKILKFTDKAFKRANIHRNTTKSLFELISKRYKMSLLKNKLKKIDK